MYTKQEITLIKEVVAFNKEDIIRILNNFDRNNLDDSQQKTFDLLIKEVNKNEYIEINPDFTKNIILGYYFDIIDCKIITAYGKDFFFVYDNKLHKLYIESFSFEDIENYIDCDGCNASKYGGFSNSLNKQEFCLKYDKELFSEIGGRTIPCEECKGNDFEEDLW